MSTKKERFGGAGRKTGNAATDPLGAVRRSPDGTMIAIMWPFPPHPCMWAVTDYRGSLGYEKPERVAHWPVVGAVPWSPAAGVELKREAAR